MSNNMFKPENWGPHFWYVLHLGSLQYDINPSYETRQRIKNFILSIPYILPCEKCRKHSTKFLNTYEYDYINNPNKFKMDDVVFCRTNLFMFFVDFHNYVNRNTNKKVYDYKEAYKLYINHLPE